jgi:hypothetical protein
MALSFSINKIEFRVDGVGSKVVRALREGGEKLAFYNNLGYLGKPVSTTG